MIHKQLLEKQRDIYDKIDALYDELYDIKRQYIKEHAPLELKYRDDITIKLQVTEESLENVKEKFLSWPRYQVGHIYYKRGEFLEWLIHPKTGELRPCLFNDITYPIEDKIISIKRTRGK